MRFWDSSAIVPLLVREETSAACLTALETSPRDMIVWWGSVTECVSALCRREREGALSSDQSTFALSRLRKLQDAWIEVEPVDRVRRIATRLLRVHPLRAADALQLAAALVVSAEDPSCVEFLTLDARLSEAASKEGLSVTGFGEHSR
jgi:predicted nucleic acid-binding protein